MVQQQVHYKEGFRSSRTDVQTTKLYMQKIYWRHTNYSDLSTDRNLVLSSKRLIGKTGIQSLTKITVGRFGFSCKSSLFCISLSLQENCAMFFWRIYRVARNFCGFCFVIMLFKRGVCLGDVFKLFSFLLQPKFNQ